MQDIVDDIVARFGLQPHPEGGYFSEVYRAPARVNHPLIPAAEGNERPASTLIYFLLGREDFSAFHRVRNSDEVWHIYGGGPIELHIINDAGEYERRHVFSDVTRGAPTSVVPANYWQAARVADGAEWALGGCTVAPGFEFADFEMPSRDRLTTQFPQHANVIRRLTRPPR